MGLPMGLDQSDGFDNDPIPLGDEVSMGVITPVSDNFNQMPTPTPISMPTPQYTNPNRVTGNLLKSVFLKNVLERINPSQNLQKLHHQFTAARKVSF